MNYLKATGFKRGLLINFGALSLQYKRIVWGYEDIKPLQNTLALSLQKETICVICEICG
jgi:hypothetical protein